MKFPEYDSIHVGPTVTQSIRFKTVRTQFDDEKFEKRRQKWLFPKRTFKITQKYIDKDEAESLWQFYIQTKGGYQDFNFFLPEPFERYPSYEKEYIGTGTGYKTTFNLPCRYSTS